VSTVFECTRNITYKQENLLHFFTSKIAILNQSVSRVKDPSISRILLHMLGFEPSYRKKFRSTPKQFWIEYFDFPWKTIYLPYGKHSVYKNRKFSFLLINTRCSIQFPILWI